MEEPRRYGRGLFLATVVGGLTSLAWGRPVWSRVSGAFEGVPLAPQSGWRIYTVAATMPTFDRAQWRLDVDGLVDRPLRLTYDDLRGLPRTVEVRDFHCVTGWSVEDVRWTGVRLSDLFAQ